MVYCNLKKITIQNLQNEVKKVSFNNKTLILGFSYEFMSFSFFLKKKQGCVSRFIYATGGSYLVIKISLKK